jgi:predicted ATPase
VLVEPSYSEDVTSNLDEAGSNLAWVLASLHNEHPDRFNQFNQIIDAFRQVIPIVKRVRSRRAKIPRQKRGSITINEQKLAFAEADDVIGPELLFDMLSGDGLPASMASEGTLVVLAVLTLVYGGEDEANLIMLDDIELGLHPKAQRDLVRQLKKLQEKQKKLQILLSTHSPYVVDELTPGDVWLFAPDEEGCAAYARLSDHPDAKRALDVLTTGEFWSAEGEEWALKREKRTTTPETSIVP